MHIRVNDISIKKKLTITFIIFILIPTLLLCIYSYSQIQRYIRSEIISSGNATLDQVKYNIMSKVEIIENVSSNVCYNSGLIAFLKRTFTSTPTSIDEYFNIIVPIVEHAVLYHKFSIADISVYMTNESIPEGFGYFRYESTLKDMDWYKNFMQSNKNSAWIIPEESDLNDKSSSAASLMFMFVRKISPPNDRHLGLVTVKIPQSELFSSLQLPDNPNSFFVLTTEGNILFSVENDTIPSEEVLEKIITMPSGHFIYDNILYLTRTLSSLDIIICKTVPLSNRSYAMNSLTLTFIVLILIVFLMVILFFIILRGVFTEINNQLDLMTLAVQNDFKYRIPVKRKDEIGQIAQHFNTLLEKINVLLKNLVIKETAHKDAQFKALQFQINPHFIYNTIDVFVNKLALSGNYQIADSMASFGRMLRYNIGKKEIFATLQMEIDYIKSYIGIQKLRFEERLKLDISVPKEFLSFRIIKFILQPVVENSILHNMDTDNIVLNVSISANVSDENLIISISDNGKGIEPGKLKELNTQFKTSEYKHLSNRKSTNIGMQNINERLKLFYGNEHYVRMESEYGKGTTTIITIPTNIALG
ncbi:MAG: histidine kinase [Clostridiaceae bacterium]|nr:histidine kinase [Clostridiaceae bacterium]